MRKRVKSKRKSIPARFSLDYAKRKRAGTLTKSMLDGTYRRNPYKQVWRKGRSIGLHRARWEDKHGKIPKGMVIHHKDHNKFNAVMRNLSMERQSDHARKHGGDWSRD